MTALQSELDIIRLPWTGGRGLFGDMVRTLPHDFALL